MDRLKRLINAVDRWQRRHKKPGVTYGVVKKFGDDNANLLVVSLAWYGFTAIFPLLLVAVTVLGFIGQKSLGSDVVATLHKFPVIGSSFNPANGTRLHGSAFALVIGLLGLLYGAQGVTQTAQTAMASVWDVPQIARTGFLPRLGRSFAGLAIIGGTFLINAALGTYVTRPGESYAVRVPTLVGLLVFNGLCYWASFIVLTPKGISPRKLIPGAIVGSVGFTALITVGAGLLTHQLKNASNTYGTFGSVIGIVTILLLLAKLSLYAAELNPVLDRALYPRALPMGEMTEADRKVEKALVHEQRRSADQAVGVGFGENADREAAADASQSTERSSGDGDPSAKNPGYPPAAESASGSA
jgi:uncharacterized BrkB/YihY/UPF0761 family membrane protein